MNKIQIQILNPAVIENAEQMLVCAARLTQHGHTIKNLDDFITLYHKPYTEKQLKTLVSLPHPTIQKFALINIVVVGASRRFLAQITRHQNEVKFMSASLQYSDYSRQSNFVVPYAFSEHFKISDYLTAQEEAMSYYSDAIEAGIDNDAAGYLAPQGLRNVLLISATPYQWKHMIRQRTCRRNTAETRYIMLRIWEALRSVSPCLFTDCGPFCTRGVCQEGKMSCKCPVPSSYGPSELIEHDFPLLYGGTLYES